MNRYLSLFFGALLLLHPSMGLAEGSAPTVFPSSAEISQVFSYGSPLWGGFEIDRPELTPTFYQGLSFANQGDPVAAAQQFKILRALLDRDGYRNSPEFSFELLRRAAQVFEQGRVEEATQQVSFALLLSPRHPRVFLAAAGLYEVVGFKAAAEYILEALSLAPKYPLLCITLLLNIAIVAGLSLSLALLFVSVVQLLRGGEHLVKEVGKLFPRAFAGLAGAIILPLCLVGPLFLGLLAALAVWSMLLSLYRPSCKYYAFAVSGVILLWAWLIPNARIIGIQTQLPHMQAIEDINANNFNAEGEKTLLKLAEEENPSQAVLLGAALVAQHNDNLVFAAKLYQRLRQDLLLPYSIQQIVSLNSAVILYHEKKIPEAKAITDELEKSGFNSFELFHNSALINIELFETEKYRRYFDMARAIDKHREDILQLSAVEGVAPSVTAKLASLDFWNVVRASAKPSEKDSLLAATLTSSLLKGGTPKTLESVAAATLFVGIIGIIGTMRRKHRRRKSTVFVANSSMKDGSMMWCILPAGYAIAGKYPISGAMYLAVVIASIVIAFGAPMDLFAIAPLEVTLSRPFLMLAVALLFLSTTWSLILYRRSPSVEG